MSGACPSSAICPVQMLTSGVLSPGPRPGQRKITGFLVELSPAQLAAAAALMEATKQATTREQQASVLNIAVLSARRKSRKSKARQATNIFDAFTASNADESGGADVPTTTRPSTYANGAGHWNVHSVRCKHCNCRHASWSSSITSCLCTLLVIGLVSRHAVSRYSIVVGLVNTLPIAGSSPTESGIR